VFFDTKTRNSSTKYTSINSSYNYNDPIQVSIQKWMLLAIEQDNEYC
jgi:hypothetical protein